MPLSTAAFAFGLLLLVPAGWATAMEKHSGVVVAADDTRITIDEMGPWHGPATQPMRRTFQRTSGTKIMLAERTKDGLGGWKWAFNDQPAEPSDPHPGDFVIATGISHSVADFVQAAFEHVGIDDWRAHVDVDPKLVRPADAGEQRGNAGKARTVLGWRTTVDFAQMVGMMVDADLDQRGQPN